MRNNLSILFFIASFGALAQMTPGNINYQAAIRDANGALIVKTSVNFQFSVISNSSTGNIVFQETQLSTTNSFGLVNLKIGSGTPVIGTISGVDWSDGPYSFKVEMDASGGTNFSLFGVSEISSVPYSLFADKAATVDSVSMSQISDLPVFSLSNDTLFFGSLGSLYIDGSVTNEIQDLQLNGDSLSISLNPSATKIDLSGYLDNTTLTEAQVDSFANNNGYLLTEVDSSITNEIQFLSMSGDSLFLSNGGYVILPAEIDGSITNEIQVLSISGDSLFLSNGGYVLLPSGQNIEEVLTTGNDANGKDFVDLGNVAIGTQSGNPSALLDVSSTTQGLLPPRMTRAQRDLINNPPAGLMLWCIDCGINGEIQVFNGTEFTNIDGSSRSDIWVDTLGNVIDGEAVADRSGYSVSLSKDGTIVAIGSPENDGNGNRSGHVRVFQYNSGTTTWVQLGSDIEGEAAGDLSGYSVSLSDDGSYPVPNPVVAIGAPRNDGNGINSGHVRVFKFISGSWVQMGSDIDGEATGDRSGYSISYSNGILAIGAPSNYSTVGSWGTLQTGHVRVFEYNSGTTSWVQIGSDINGDASYSQCGFQIAQSNGGTIMAISQRIGSPYPGSTLTPVVRVYVYNNTQDWVQLGDNIPGNIIFSQGVSLISSTSSIALSSFGTIIAIGDWYTGKVNVYELVSGYWLQIGSDIDGEATGDRSGFSVSLSSDGSIVAIGAPESNGNGSKSGHVRLYQNVGGTWTRMGIVDIDGIASDDLSGFSVSLSSDGSILAIGAPTIDLTKPGYVRVVRK